MKKLSIKVLVLSALVTVFSISAAAQQEFILDSDNSKLIISGTSSAHDWEMIARNFSSKATLKLKSEEISDITGIHFSATVEDIESGKRIMDNKAHEALQEKRHPKITFQLTEGDPVIITDGTATLAGTLTIAGKSRQVNFTCDVSKEGSSQISVKGSVPLKMTDFGIEPPTAMFGALQTGDEIKVNFDFQFDKSSKELTGIFPVK